MVISSQPKQGFNLVSIIVPIYNRASFVEPLLSNILEQEYRPLEVLIIDDGSTDNTKSSIDEWMHNHESVGFTVEYFWQENSGAPSARNLGMRAARGHYLQFLDSDDMLHPSKIYRQAEELGKGQADFAFCDFEFVDEFDVTKKLISNAGHLVYRMATGHSISVSTPLIRRSLIQDVVEWDESLTRNQDMDFLIKVALVAKNSVHTLGSWCYYKEHEQGRISDCYLTTRPEFSKRVRGLLRLWMRRRKSIPVKNYPYLALHIVYLVRTWVRNTAKMAIRRMAVGMPKRQE